MCLSIRQLWSIESHSIGLAQQAPPLVGDIVADLALGVSSLAAAGAAGEEHEDEGDGGGDGDGQGEVVGDAVLGGADLGVLDGLLEALEHDGVDDEGADVDTRGEQADERGHDGDAGALGEAEEEGDEGDAGADGVHDEGDAQGLEARLGLPAPAVGGLGDGLHDVGGVIADLGLGALKDAVDLPAVSKHTEPGVVARRQAEGSE